MCAILLNRYSLTFRVQKGHYLPIFASEIYDRNAVAKSEGKPLINLQSVMIGNGYSSLMTCVLYGSLCCSNNLCSYDLAIIPADSRWSADMLHWTNQYNPLQHA